MPRGTCSCYDGHASSKPSGKASVSFTAWPVRPKWSGLLKALGQVGERNVAEIQRVMQDFFHQRDSMEAIPREELIARLKEGAVTILDVRPEEEFALGHLPGAINVPISQLQRRLSELPKRREIVAYCRGPYCVMSFEAVAALRAKGYRVRRLEDGFPEWKAAGHAVELET